MCCVVMLINTHEFSLRQIFADSELASFLLLGGAAGKGKVPCCERRRLRGSPWSLLHLVVVTMNDLEICHCGNWNFESLKFSFKTQMKSTVADAFRFRGTRPVISPRHYLLFCPMPAKCQNDQFAKRRRSPSRTIQKRDPARHNNNNKQRPHSFSFFILL
jgi:hypothetical protein